MTKKDEARKALDHELYNYLSGGVMRTCIRKAIDAYGAACAEEAQTKATQYLREERGWETEVRAIAHTLGVEYAPDSSSTYPGELEALLVRIDELLRTERDHADCPDSAEGTDE